MISVAALIAAGIAPTQARVFAEPLAAACARFRIDTGARIAGFVAQCRVESNGFARLEEDLYYRDADRVRRIFSGSVPDLQTAARLTRNPQGLANHVYAGRLGNGDAASGDGWRFRGRGLKQLTGRANYAEAALALGRPLVEQPDLVAQPEAACLTAAWFWAARGCNTFADAANWDAITRVVNGPAMLQVAERRQYSSDAVAVFSA